MTSASLKHGYKWALVSFRIERHLPSRSLVLYDGELGNFKIHLPITSSGLVHELIFIPTWIHLLFYKDPESLVSVNVAIKTININEKIWRMSYRVFNTYKHLTKKQRNIIGLTTWKCISNLSGAYKIASDLRWQISESEWLSFNHQNFTKNESEIVSHIDKARLTTKFYILIAESKENDDDNLISTLNSLSEQFYKNFTCIILGDNSSKNNLYKLNLLIKKVGYQSFVIAINDLSPWLKEFNESINNNNDWLMFMKSGETLPPHSLYSFATKINKGVKHSAIYSDDAVQSAPLTFKSSRFKPDFSIEHIKSTNFIGNALILNGPLVYEAGGISLECTKHGFFDLLLRSIDRSKNKANYPHHLPSVLFYRSAQSQPLNEYKKELSWYKKSIKSHLSRNKIAASVNVTSMDCFRVNYELPSSPPLVSIIILTKNAFHLINQCVSSILGKTTYPNYELLIVDHESDDPEVLNYFNEISKLGNIKIIGFKGAFNFSAMNNMAEKKTNGEILCLLNNDTEVISNNWLDEMVGHLLQDKVGVVGAKLLFPNNLVQHGGDTVGPGGCANHLHSLIDKHDPGYCNRAIVAQELSAVTAACLITWKEIYRDLGGFNEKRLKVAFNDVDYCLRVREAGYKIIWTPHAELYHHESMTRGQDVSLMKIWHANNEAKYMRKKWAHLMHNDPFYNINLSYEHIDFSLNRLPYTEKPWEEQYSKSPPNE